MSRLHECNDVCNDILMPTDVTSARAVRTLLPLSAVIMAAVTIDCTSRSSVSSKGSLKRSAEQRVQDRASFEPLPVFSATGNRPPGS